MPRPPLPLGTTGNVRTYHEGARWRARCTYRDYDGKTREIQRHGRTEATAKRALAEAVRDRARYDGVSVIRPETRVVVLAEAWWLSMQSGDRSPTTLVQYRYRLDHQVIPAIGELRVRELTPGLIDRHLQAIAAKYGAATAKMVRTVLSGLCGFATRHDALDRNPVRDAGRIPMPAKQAPKSLSIAQARQLRAMLTYDEKAISRDLPDLVGFLLATGLRIGEAAAIRWEDINLNTAVVTVRGTVVRLPKLGLMIKPTKTAAGNRLLKLPSWAVDLLRTRSSNEKLRSEQVVFPAALGGLRDPSNTQADFREALDTAGFDWVTSHVFRKTTASLMDAAGLSARAAADQLGHVKVSMTSDRYFGRGVSETGAAAVLEALG